MTLAKLISDIESAQTGVDLLRFRACGRVAILPRENCLPCVIEDHETNKYKREPVTATDGYELIVTTWYHAVITPHRPQA